MCVRFLLAGSVIFSVQALSCYRSTFSAPIPSPGSCRPVRKAVAYSAPCRYTCGYFQGRDVRFQGFQFGTQFCAARLQRRKFGIQCRKVHRCAAVQLHQGADGFVECVQFVLVLGGVSVLGQLKVFLNKGVVDGFQLGMDGSDVLDLSDCPYTVFVLLVSEFNSIYCFNLRGDQRTQGELSRKEGGKIFGSGSRTPVAITILLKKKGVKKDGFVRYYDIGDYLTRQQKLDKVKEFDNVSQIGWKIITPDINGDWVNLRNPQYMNFFPIGERRKESEISYFSDNFSTGMVTSRDAWLYSFDYKSNNAESMISFFNQEQQRCELLFEKMLGENKLSKNQRTKEAFFENNRSVDSHKISWSRGLLNAFCKGEPLSYKGSRKIVMHRPFCKEWCFVAPKVIESPSKWERIFPEEDSTNYVIAIPGKSKRRFSALITSVIQDYDMAQHANAFPLYIYEKETIKDDGQLSLFGESEKRTIKWNKRYALSDMILHKYRELYGNKVTKEDIFFYIYAVLQTPSFVDGYADDLSKGVTRIPTLAHFVDYVRIGRELADLHLKYEKPVSAEELGVTIEMHKEDYTVVDRMRFGKGKDKSIIEYNPYITIRNIPAEAYNYIVNGKSAIEWIVEQYAVTTDKASGIVNDPNTYAGGKYIFDLLLSIISVSLKTQELIAQLPEYKEI